jgi:hypothetical protein
MKKSSINLEIYNSTHGKHENNISDKIKTTDINILLNRVKISKKIEFKKKIIFSSLLMLSISLIGVFFLLQ